MRVPCPLSVIRRERAALTVQCAYRVYVAGKEFERLTKEDQHRRHKARRAGEAAGGGPGWKQAGMWGGRGLTRVRAWQAAEEARLQAEIQAIHMQVGRPACFFVMGR